MIWYNKRCEKSNKYPLRHLFIPTSIVLKPLSKKKKFFSLSKFHYHQESFQPKTLSILLFSSSSLIFTFFLLSPSLSFIFLLPLFFFFFFNRLIVYTGMSIPLACNGRCVAVKKFIGPPRWPQLNLRSRLAR